MLDAVLPYLLVNYCGHLREILALRGVHVDFLRIMVVKLEICLWLVVFMGPFATLLRVQVIDILLNFILRNNFILEWVESFLLPGWMR